MAVNINADTVVGGAVVTADASGQLALQAAGTTVATLTSTSMTVTQNVTLNGQSDLRFADSDSSNCFGRWRLGCIDWSIPTDRW